MSKTEKSTLPDTNYISLTKALSLAVFGDCMTDADWSAAKIEEMDDRKRRWGINSGLRGVLEYAEMLAGGKEPSLPEKGPDREFVKKQHIVLKKVIERAEEYKGDVADFCDKLRSYLDASDDNDKRWKAFLKTLQYACQSGEAEILGDPCDTSPDMGINGPTEVVPKLYFTHPIWIVCGKDRLDPGNPDADDNAPHLEWALKRDKHRKPYRRPRISRHHFQIVRYRFLEAVGETVEPNASDDGQKRQLPSQSGEAQVAQGKTYSKRQLRRWYEKHVSEWPKDKPPPNRDEDWKLAKNELGWVPKQAVIEFRGKLAPDAWKAKGRRAKK